MILNAIIGDLFNLDTINASEIRKKMDASHYGFPSEGTDFMKFLD